MPAEWAEHEATWMVFPPAVYEGGVALGTARAAWAEVALAIAGFERLRLVVAPGDRAAAEALCGEAVSYVDLPVDDAWARDSGCTFVLDDGRLAAVDWTFNGWGAQAWASWERDDRLAAELARRAGAPVTRSNLVNEGGGIEVDGEGTVILTETVQLDPGRNLGWDRARVEAELARTIGVERAVWLERGLTGDYAEFGTRGHVDLVAKFAAPGVVLVHHQANADHPDHEVSRSALAVLEAAGLEVVPLLAPARLEAGGRLCDWSYVNCYLANGAVVAGTFDDPADEAAVATLEAAFPGRRVVTVDARTLFALGGGVHCVTQQQPRAREA